MSTYERKCLIPLGDARSLSYSAGDAHAYVLKNRALIRVRVADTQLKSNGSITINSDMSIRLDNESDDNSLDLDVQLRMDSVVFTPKQFLGIAIPKSKPMESEGDHTEYVEKSVIIFSSGSFVYKKSDSEPGVFFVKTSDYHVALCQIRYGSGFSFTFQSYDIKNFPHQIPNDSTALEIDNGRSIILDNDRLMAAGYVFAEHAYLDSMGTPVKGPRLVKLDGKSIQRGSVVLFKCNADLSDVTNNFKKLGQISIGDKLGVIASDDGFKMMRQRDNLGTIDAIFSESHNCMHEAFGIAMKIDPGVMGSTKQKCDVFVTGKNVDTDKGHTLKRVSCEVKYSAIPLLFKIDGSITYVVSISDLNGMPVTLDSTWDIALADPPHNTQLFITQPSKGKILLIGLDPIDPAKATLLREFVGIPTPRSIQPAGPGIAYVVCEKEFGELRWQSKLDDSFLLMGIGFIPFDMWNDMGVEKAVINDKTGLPDTTELKDWLFNVKDVPFADSLLLFMNHKHRSISPGAVRYKVELINGGKPEVVTTSFSYMVNGKREYSSPDGNGTFKLNKDDRTYFPAHLAAELRTRDYFPDYIGLVTLRVTFFDIYGKPVGDEVKRPLMIHNASAQAEILSPKVVDGMMPVIDLDKDCGSILVKRSMTEELKVSCKFTRSDALKNSASQFYSISTTRYDRTQVIELSKSDKLTKGLTVQTVELVAAVSKILDTCPIRTLGISASLQTNVTNGYQVWPQGSYAFLSFALGKETKP